MNRRQFTLMSSLTLVAGAAEGAKETLAIGLLTDVHYADKKARGSRHYRDSLAKGKEAAAFFKQQRPAVVVCLGDLVDAAPSVETEIDYLKTIAEVLDEAGVPRYHVPGNHCISTLTKEEFFEHGGSVNRKGHHSLRCAFRPARCLLQFEDGALWTEQLCLARFQHSTAANRVARERPRVHQTPGGGDGSPATGSRSPQ